MQRRRVCVISSACSAAAGALALAAPLLRAQASKWPEKTVRIVAAGPAGASADIVARLLADQLTRKESASR